jgi:hypothetical protein
MSIDGHFFIETVGWADIMSVNFNQDDPTAWIISGYAWSPNAGYIDFSAQDPSYSGTIYLPGRQAFSGTAWSPTLGYVHFSSGSLEFLNKVKIIGNLGGNFSFSTEYYLGSKFTSVSAAPFFNEIRQNIALITRLLPIGAMNTSNLTMNDFRDFLYYKKSEAAPLTID